MNIFSGDTPIFFQKNCVRLSFDIMKGIRETSFISSATSSESPEYRLIVRLTPELRTAIQGDLQNISDHLLSCGMITQDDHEDFTNCYKPTHTRAASLIRAVQNKIKLDCHYFSKFVKVLEKNKQYYSSILQRLYSHDMDSPPMYSQQHICEESSSELDETGVLLHGHVPYVQYEDDSHCCESERQYTVNNFFKTVSVFCSSCIDKTFEYFVDLAIESPFKSILVHLVFGIFLLLIMGKLYFNITSVYDLLLFLMLCAVFGCNLSFLCCTRF